MTLFPKHGPRFMEYPKPVLPPSQRTPRGVPRVKELRGLVRETPSALPAQTELRGNQGSPPTHTHPPTQWLHPGYTGNKELVKEWGSRERGWERVRELKSPLLPHSTHSTLSQR